jgi:hypothetical protein
VVIRGPAALAIQPVRIEIRRARGFRTATVVRLDAAGRAQATLQAPLGRTAIRVLYAGSESFAPGASPVRTVLRAPAKP